MPDDGQKFSDLNKNPVISPLHRRGRADCSGRAAATVRSSCAPPRLPADTTAADMPEPAEAELVSLEEADAEENTGKVKAIVPESEDDIEIDETIEDDDDDDSTFIARRGEEGDEDVTDIIGDVGSDEET